MPVSAHVCPCLPVPPCISPSLTFADLPLASAVGYWTTITEAGAGWVAKLRLSEFPAQTHDAFGGGRRAYAGAADAPQARFGAYWRADGTLTAGERRALGVGPVAERFGSPIYARYTPTSELGLTDANMRRVGVGAAGGLKADAGDAGDGEDGGGGGADGEMPWPSGVAAEGQRADAALGSTPSEESREESYVRIEYDVNGAW